MTETQTTLVWVPDPKETFIQGEFIDTELIKNKAKNIDEQFANVKIIEQDNEIKKFPISNVHPVNPSRFDKIDNMSELTHLNEPSVLHNLEKRYNDDLIYTYSGLFLVAINPYSNIKIYNQEYINLYHGSAKDENKPHIFAIAEEAYQHLLSEKVNQTILVTGESGAGKTENTKKILQYLAAITSSDEPNLSNSNNHSSLLPSFNNFEMKILQSNPILEAFGNAQTIRNNNSSRFGKFIKIEFDERGKINGAHIEWYLLEKSRVINQYKDERNYHIFYQLLSSVTENDLLKKYKLPSNSISNYKYLAGSNHSIPGVNDQNNFNELLSAFDTVGFAHSEVEEILKIIAIILHIGNIEFVSERSEQASFKNNIDDLVELLGITKENFQTAILRPKSKAGREWVHQSKNSTQAKFILNSLSRTLYEHLFSYIVDRINCSLDHGSMTANYIGLLDIAGFEIFKHNSFEQLCINYTNEKLQQFFNHHMFVLEQTEYVKENIEWRYVDYGKDLQSTIDLIEQKVSPSGILPLLDEESILPKSTDRGFLEKLITNWDKKSDRFKRSKLQKCFILKHYAGDVEYNVDGWISKNKDPLNENLLSVLSESKNNLVSEFFGNPETEGNSNRATGKSFRTASSRHIEQQISLLNQLSLSHPHFVRCIIPNNLKMAKNFDRSLILDQLRCNGVLEGIRIAREGYPNRIFFKEFCQRYNILSSKDDDDLLYDKKNYKKRAEHILSALHLDPSLFKVGTTKLFFKVGVLANVEHEKEQRLLNISILLNSQIRGLLTRSRISSRLTKLRAARIIGESFVTYNKLMEDPWYNLFTRVKPLLSSTQDIVKTKKFHDQIKLIEKKLEESEKSRGILEKTNNEANRELLSIKQSLQIETKKLEDNEKLLANTENKKEQLQTQLNEAISLREKIDVERKNLMQKHANTKTEVSELQCTLSEKEKYIKELADSKNELELELRQLNDSVSDKKDSHSTLTEENNRLSQQINELEVAIKKRESEIENLRKQLDLSENNLDLKLVTLEKNFNTSMKKLQTLINENVDLKNQIELLKKSQSNTNRQLQSKDSEMKRLKDKIKAYQDEIATISKQRDTIVSENEEKYIELKNLKDELTQLRTNYASLEEKYTDQKNQNSELSKYKHGISLDDTVKELEIKLSQQVSLNDYLHKQLSDSHSTSSINIKTQPRNQNRTMEQEYERVIFELEQTSHSLKKEINNNKELISRLRFTETRLASSSFDYQTSKAQIKKLKEIIENSDINIDLDKQLNSDISIDVNLEKLVLEVQYLKRQLELETEAKTDAENVAAALHEKFNQIQKVDSSSNIYKLKFEASEERAKSLENKLNSGALKDKSLHSGSDIFKNKDSISKYEEEINFQKLEYYKLQEILSDADKEVDKLNYEIKQYGSREGLLNDQLQRLEQDLNDADKQNEMLSSSIKQQQQTYNDCLSDLQASEAQLRDCSYALKQAEDDVQNLTDIIDKMKVQNKIKDKTIWENETERNDLEMQLQETVLELNRVRDHNNLLKSDMAHLNEALLKSRNNSQRTEEIESLYSEINSYSKNETHLKKEISTLKYKLETLGNDSEAKITDLLKQTDHYIKLTETLSIERDTIGLARENLQKEYDDLNMKANSMSSKLDSLLDERNQLLNTINGLKEEIEKTSSDFSRSTREKHDATSQMKYLEETLQFQQEQNTRNESLVQKLQDELSDYKEKYDYEKQENINIHEEHQALIRTNEQLLKKNKNMQDQLDDSSEKDTWLQKIHELEAMVTDETEQKYEEMKKRKNYELIIEDLKEKNNKQDQVISMANDDRAQFEHNVLQYNEQISELEKLVSKQELDLKKFVRDNSYYQDKVLDLEQELNFWKEKATNNKRISIDMNN